MPTAIEATGGGREIFGVGRVVRWWSVAEFAGLACSTSRGDWDGRSSISIRFLIWLSSGTRREPVGHVALFDRWIDRTWKVGRLCWIGRHLLWARRRGYGRLGGGGRRRRKRSRSCFLMYVLLDIFVDFWSFPSSGLSHSGCRRGCSRDYRNQFTAIFVEYLSGRWLHCQVPVAIDIGDFTIPLCRDEIWGGIGRVLLRGRFAACIGRVTHRIIERRSLLTPVSLAQETTKSVRFLRSRHVEDCAMKGEESREGEGGYASECAQGIQLMSEMGLEDPA